MAIKEENINRFIFAMFNLFHGMKKGMEDCCAKCGDLSEKEFVIINFVGQSQNAKMSDIADSLSAPLSTLTSIVDKLVENKFLTRYHSNEDRRVVMVTLASLGKEAYDTFVSHKLDVAQNVLSRFNTKEQNDLIRYLEMIPNSWDEKKSEK